MDREMEAVKRAILASGLDDWVHIAEVVSAARRARAGGQMLDDYPDEKTTSIDQLARLRGEWLARNERDALPLGIAAIKELLRGRFIRVGDTSNDGFVPWSGSLEEIESRIDHVAREAQYPLLPGHLFWIENTPSGDEIASPK